jgi:transcriptional regulator with PAS, ATPase and Fis domain
VQECVRNNALRQDFLYRINTVEIHLPPLRERTGDISLLTDFFIERYSRKYNAPARRVEAEAYRRLEQYGWPGNVRELKHTVERAVILHDASSFRPADFALAPPDMSPDQPDQIVLADLNLEEAEKHLLRRALRTHHGNISKAAEALGITRTSLYRRMQKYDL